MVLMTTNTTCATWQTHVKLCSRVHGVCANPFRPVLEGEACVGLSDLLVTEPGAALRGIVELSEDKVEWGVLECLGKANVRKLALRSGGEDSTGLQALDSVCECVVVGVEILLFRNLVFVRFKIEVETVNIGVTEWTRTVPSSLFGSKSICKERSKPPCYRVTGQIVVCWGSSTK